jgi:hypothetical protein
MQLLFQHVDHILFVVHILDLILFSPVPCVLAFFLPESDSPGTSFCINVAVPLGRTLTKKESTQMPTADNIFLISGAPLMVQVARR